MKKVKTMIIDGGPGSETSMIYTIVHNTVKHVKYLVATHPHEDHVGGLPPVLAVFPTDAIYAPTRTYSSKVFDDFLYYADQQGQEVMIPAPGDTFFLGDAQEGTHHHPIQPCSCVALGFGGGKNVFQGGAFVTAVHQFAPQPF